ncbi:hypothetical protein KI387_031233, partial [Taxus chinensis]
LPQVLLCQRPVPRRHRFNSRLHRQRRSHPLQLLLLRHLLHRPPLLRNKKLHPRPSSGVPNAETPGPSTQDSGSSGQFVRDAQKMGIIGAAILLGGSAFLV